MCYQIERYTVIGDIKTTHWSQFDSLAETKECPLGNVNIDYRDKSDVLIADDRRSVFPCRGLQCLMMSQEKKGGPIWMMMIIRLHTAIRPLEEDHRKAGHGYEKEGK